MSTHKVCFRSEIRKVSAFFRCKSTLSVAMGNSAKIVFVFFWKESSLKDFAPTGNKFLLLE